VRNLIFWQHVAKYTVLLERDAVSLLCIVSEISQD